jgi:hypothetical protein
VSPLLFSRLEGEISHRTCREVLSGLDLSLVGRERRRGERVKKGGKREGKTKGGRKRGKGEGERERERERERDREDLGELGL